MKITNMKKINTKINQNSPVSYNVWDWIKTSIVDRNKCCSKHVLIEGDNLKLFVCCNAFHT